ncbi:MULTISPECIES: ATP-dependent Clp protease proteolytic subunit [Chloroflexus]|jgi:ATP-dependent Clp protease protease subunit|uniref:ATP-dependent Clp protease proteolytic subunit n=1 Tax=Chloroflexus aggregans (strain MD-66 / DSM 9485) TaxID=326427 RepID=B8G4H6_CHLAD|nr:MULTISPECIES: ATP-dependent Clp protease proteolytic subunit [Chloroflexus]ACL23582.1 Endopeptidase Clp [Chloroflexus aggregans DSM 9485]GIV88984.1 MAG: ATP-dependent Clp protease proteolytic subunit [Chloroflexus sp.]
MPSIPVPTIVERTSRGERSWDIFSRLLKERVIIIGEPIDDELASSVVAQLLVLQQQDPERDIWMYINSPGGVIRAGLAIYDTMQLVTPDVCTVCVGRAASMATVLLCAGAKGKRFALPHATIHSHPAGGGVEGYAPDVQIAVDEMLRLQRLLREIMAKHSGQTVERLEADFSRDFYMTASQAVEYGLIDAILTPR